MKAIKYILTGTGATRLEVQLGLQPQQQYFTSPFIP